MVKFRFVLGQYVTSFQKSDFYQTIKIRLLHQQFISQISTTLSIQKKSKQQKNNETAKNDY